MTATPDRTESIFAAAVVLPTIERAALLDRECAGDTGLRGRLEALLRAHDRAGHLLDRPANGSPDRTGAFTPPNEQPGVVIVGRYKLLEAIGEGGMGTVWVAEQTEPVRRKVALKLIKAGMDSKSVLARFEAERQALAVMDHPNIAKVLDGGLTELGRPFFVMEYVKGVPITEYCDATRLSVPERLNLFVQVCSAVQHAHQKGIIHRDLKPSNILVAPYDDKPVPKVIDFGLAKAMHQSLTERTLHTAHETVLGTPLYMSPEQAQLNNLDVDTRSDIYSLGVLLYELLTGTTPLEKQRFKEAAWDEIKRIIREEEPPRPSTRLSSTNTLPSLAAGRQTEPARLTKLVRGELDWIVMKALEKDRNRRYETANSFAADVQRYLMGEPVQAAPPGAGYRLRKFVKRNKAQVLAASLIFLALLAGITVTSMGLVQAERRRAEADDARAAESERAEGERRAKLDAQAQKAEAEEQRTRAVAGEKLASDRLTQVEIEKKKAEAEKQVAEAVRGFLQFRLLNQVDVDAQADVLLSGGGSLDEITENPTVKELLNRAARELTPEKIDATLPDQPRVQAEILLTMGIAYRQISEFEKAINFLQRSVAMHRKHFGPDDEVTLVALANLAFTYRHAGQTQTALVLLDDIHKLRVAKFGANDPSILGILRSKAMVVRMMGDYPRAIALAQEVHRARVAALGADDPMTLEALDVVAEAQQLAGNTREAIKLFEQIRDVRTAKFGANHPRTLHTLNGLANAYRDAGKHAEAIDLGKKVRDLVIVKYGAKHPVTWTTLNNLALALGDVGDWPEALELLEKVRVEQSEKLGPDHPGTLTTLNNLAVVYRAALQLPKAIDLFQKVHAARAERLGADHPQTLTTLANLATALEDDGQSKRAIAMFEQVRDAQTAKLGADHPNTLATINHLAGAYLDAGKPALALTMFEQVRDARTKVLGADHPETLATMALLAGAYRANNRLGDAIALYEKVRDARIDKLGADHPNTLATLNNLASAYQDAGRLSEAIALFLKVHEVRIAKLGADHRDTLVGMQYLGVAYYRAKQLDKSIPLFEELLKRREKKFGRDDRETLRTLANLGLNYRDAGRLDDALLVMEEAYRKAKPPGSLAWIGNELLTVYIQAGKSAEGAKLIQELVATARAQWKPESPQWTGGLTNRALQLLRLKQYADAETLMRECLALRPKLLDKNELQVWHMAMAESLLGAALLGQGKHAEAAPHLIAGYEEMKKLEKSMPQIKFHIVEAVRRLVDLYDATKVPAEADRWRKELERARAETKTAEKK